MQQAFRLLVLSGSVVVAGACGGGESPSPSGGGTTPPPGGSNGVASVAILSASADSLFALRDTVRMTAAARDASGNALSNATLTWSSSDPSIATVAPSTGPSTSVASVGNGAVTITATSGSATASKVVVIAQRASSVAISPTSTDSIFAFGDTRAFSATVRDSRGSGMSTAAVQWAIDKPAIATISASAGVNTIATAIANGAAVLTARSGTLATSVGMVVRQKVSQVVVSPTAVSLALSASAFLTITAKDSRGNTMTNVGTPRYSSSDSTKARVSELGVVSGVSPGTATITVVLPTPDGDRSATVPVTVGAFGTDVTVTITDNDFAPAIVDILVGGKVTWLWRGSASHDVRGTGAGNPIAGPLQSQGTYVLTFNTPGTYNYLCTQHVGMNGVVTVH